MAWSAPATKSVGDVGRAADWNVLVNDLRYLKGLDGLVAIDSQMTVPSLIVGGAGMSLPAWIILNADGGLRTRQSGATRYRSDWGVDSSGMNMTVYDDIGATYLPMKLDCTSLNMRASGSASMLYASNAGVGIGTTSPQGKLHGYDSISGFLHWKYDGVDGTARTIIPDGAGDVLYAAYIMCVARASDGGYNHVGFGIGASGALYDVPLGSPITNTLRFQWNANGSVTVQRVSGSSTIKVGVWALWI